MRPDTLTDEDLEEFMELKEKQKLILARVKEIRDLCEIKGSFCTDKFVCSVYEQDQVRLVGLEECARILGRDTLEQNDLIKVVTFSIVKVTRKIG